MSFVVSIVLKEPLLHQIDKIRGDVSRSKFISRVLESAIYPKMKNESTIKNGREVSI